MLRKRWWYGFVLCLLALGLLVPSAVQPAVYVLAQSDAEEEDEDALLSEEPTAPIAPRPDSVATDEVDEEKPQQSEHQLYIPHIVTEQNREQAREPEVQAAAVWSTIAFEGFEGVWPPSGGKWIVHDVNGTQVPASHPNTSFVWDDTSSKAKTGSWSAHPTDGPPYVNLTDTYMQYGPFSLVGATDARLSFWYLLDTETGYDFFTWEFSCGGVNWDGYSRSGTTANTTWVRQTVSLKPCAGKNPVYVRFTFESEYAFTDQGVWVDDVRIEKFQ